MPEPYLIVSEMRQAVKDGDKWKVSDLAEKAMNSLLNYQKSDQEVVSAVVRKAIGECQREVGLA